MGWRLASHQELLDRSGGDPFVATEMRDSALGLVSTSGWVASDLRGDGRLAAYAVLDHPIDPSATTELVAAVEDLATEQDARLTWFNTSEGVQLALGPDWQGETHWVWMSTTEVATRHDDWQLVELHDQNDAAELRAFALPINPIWEGDPGLGRNRFWLAARGDDGRLLGCGTAHETSVGVGHLAGIVIDPAVRGRGLGLAITIGLSERVLATDALTTLSAYADNASAIGVYLRAGYRVNHRFHSRWREPRRG